MTEDTKFDGILMTLLQQKGNIDAFFDTVYGFLRRNTEEQRRSSSTIAKPTLINTLPRILKNKSKRKRKSRSKKKREN